MSEQDDHHLRIINPAGGRKSARLNVIMRPVLSVIEIPTGEDKGRYLLAAHGKNDQGEDTVIQLRTFEFYDDAAITFSLLKRGRIAAEDVPDFDVTERMRLTWARQVAKSSN